MNLDVLLLAHPAFNEHLGDLLAVVALQLDDVQAGVLLLDNAPIAGEVLLKHLQDFLRINLLREALNRGQGFTTIALVETHIYMG